MTLGIYGNVNIAGIYTIEYPIDSFNNDCMVISMSSPYARLMIIVNMIEIMNEKSNILIGNI